MVARRAARMGRDQAMDLGYSIRRHYVDEFHIRRVSAIRNGSLVLDLGGNRIRKRGLFDIDRYGLQVVYANLSVAKQPHVQTDAAFLPFAQECFDAVVCSELLEHVLDPTAVVAEIHRVLKVAGTLLICVPFMNRIHADPHDYGRYTDFYWHETLVKAGFESIHIEKQGLFWSVLADMLRDKAYAVTSRGRLQGAWIRKPITLAMGVAKRMALAWDDRSSRQGNTFSQSFTTGFGIKAVKS